MSKLLAIIFVVLLSSLSIFAQIEIPPATANWQILAPENEEFSIEFPVSPSSATFDRNELLRRYYGSINGTYFFISSDPLKDSTQYKTAEKFITAFQPVGTTENIGKISAKKYSFADSENFYHTVITAKTKNRFYVFQTISETEKNPLTERFFTNLKINEKRDLKIIEVLTVPSQLSGNGLSSGFDSNLPNPPAPIQSPDLEAKKTSAPLSLQSKPRANYTDFARFYEISGSVYLKITFLSNGEIGTVTTVKKLPFGLTQSAIEAAKKIKFNPAVRNSVPIAVTKTVVYSFTIY